MKLLVIHEEAQIDIDEAAAYYSRRGAGLGAALLAEMDDISEAIWILAVAHGRRHPDYWLHHQPG